MRVFDTDEGPGEESIGDWVDPTPDAVTPRVPDGAQELAYRESDGISVTLSWHLRANAVFVHVRNERDEEEFVLNPPKGDALFAFYHPYAAARRVLETGPIAA